LRHLFLGGNPLSLLPNYRERVLSGFGPDLLVLDDMHITRSERSAATDELRAWAEKHASVAA
ncbi:unnamed protein product, partial [Laminaria digitata]